MKNTFIVLLILCSIRTYAQTESTKNPLSISGYVETYYAYDFGNPDNHNRPGFAYSHTRHNEA